jgi:hypothetical protein
MCSMRQHLIQHSEPQKKKKKDRIINLPVTGFMQRYRRTKWNIDSKGFWRWCEHSELLGFWTFSIDRYSRN